MTAKTNAQPVRSITNLVQKICTDDNSNHSKHSNYNNFQTSNPLTNRIIITSPKEVNCHRKFNSTVATIQTLTKDQLYKLCKNYTDISKHATDTTKTNLVQMTRIPQTTPCL